MGGVRWESSLERNETVGFYSVSGKSSATVGLKVALNKEAMSSDLSNLNYQKLESPRIRAWQKKNRGMGRLVCLREKTAVKFSFE